jgi:hypothetical protein
MFPKVHAGMEMKMDDVRIEGSNKTEGNNWEKHLQIFSQKTKRCPGLVWQTMWKVGHDDPRRVIHSLKVGLSLSLVSLLYLAEPLFNGIGQSAIWAVMTVVVVLEFTAGLSLSIIVFCVPACLLMV